MALNIKNLKVERLAAEVAALTGESKTEAIRKALEERKERLAFRIARHDRGRSLLRFLQREVWPRVPAEVLGRKLSNEEEERILGYGPEGV
jgi:antitoxin VapB